MSGARQLVERGKVSAVRRCRGRDPTNSRGGSGSRPAETVACARSGRVQGSKLLLTVILVAEIVKPVKVVPPFRRRDWFQEPQT